MGRRRRALVITTLLTIIGTTLVAGAGPAAAAPFDVRLKAKGFRVTSGACRDIPFTVSHTAGYLDRFTASVEVWKGSKYQGDTFDYVYDSSGPLRGSYYWCPYKGVGTYRLGPTQVEWDDYSADVGGSFRDGSTVRFKVLQAARFRDLRATNRNGVRTISGRLTYFDVGASAWRRAPQGVKIRLQRQTAIGWEPVKTGRIGTKGHVAIPVRAAKVREYRLASPRTTRTWDARSSILRK
jgi:hypothetical protein